MKNLKRIVAVILTLLLISSSFVCVAADSEKQYHKYDKVLLLGDSEASGFKDYTYVMTEFTRVDNSYAALIADELGGELIPMACPGFRTVELRYMLDDEYEGDDYLFSAVPHHSPEEIIAKKDDMRQAIKDADLITIGIGGNDWGAYLGWVMTDLLEGNPLPEDFEKALREFLQNASLGDDIVKVMVEMAQAFNAWDVFLDTLSKALVYAFKTLEENWHYLVQYIYDVNPDVTLVVVGMFVTTYKTEEGAPDVVIEPDPMAVEVEQMMIDFGNKPMVDNEEKYGYIYVDTAGTVVETCHPTDGGHRHIANKILEALPDARFPFTDVSINSAEYKAIEYMYFNDLMKGIDETTFGGEQTITEAEFSSILSKLSDKFTATDSTKELTKLKLTSDLYNLGETGLIPWFTNFLTIIKLIFSGDAFKTVTRTEAAYEIYQKVRYN